MAIKDCWGLEVFSFKNRLDCNHSYFTSGSDKEQKESWLRAEKRWFNYKPPLRINS